ncbi:MAG: Sjogren's syndrome/scleroderma autoantigen 1 family protein [Candidatus Thorarchaeota archaeon]
MVERDDSSIKKMAELLRRGATMLAESCPQCGSPLLKVGDDIYCATCDRRIVIVGPDEEVETQAVKVLIPQLRETLIRKLSSLTSVLEDETDPESLTKLANLMVLLLQALHKLENMPS